MASTGVKLEYNELLFSTALGPPHTMPTSPPTTAASCRLALAQNQISALELIDTVLQQADAINPQVNALIDINPDAARAAARQSDDRRRRGETLGPLDGLPVTVKDNLAVRGMKATWGSRVYADRIAPEDDPSIARLRAGGAVIWAKTNLPELALAGVTDNALFGATRNPLDLTLTPGGSSGGAAAALVTGLGSLAVGTDAGGSARRPAAYTGTVGFRPSNGMIARGTYFPTTTYDCQAIAPMARSVADTQLLFNGLRGSDTADRTTLMGVAASTTMPQRLRIRYFATVDGKPVDPAITAGVATAARRLEAMGHAITECAAPYTLADMEAIWSVLIAAGTAAARRSMPAALPAPLTPVIEGLIERASKLSAADYVDTIAQMHAIRRSFDRLFTECDVLLSPTSPCFPWTLEQPYPKTIAGRDAGPRDAAIFYPFVNIAGLPAIAIPVGGIDTPLPVSMQLVAGYGRDDTLLALAQAIETAHPWL